jgi:hypothetical protein
MVPQPGDRFPFATLPGDRKWYPLFPDPWLAEVTDQEAEIVASVCEPLASELGYTREGRLLAAEGELLPGS